GNSSAGCSKSDRRADTDSAGSAGRTRRRSGILIHLSAGTHGTNRGGGRYFNLDGEEKGELDDCGIRNGSVALSLFFTTNRNVAHPFGSASSEAAAEAIQTGAAGVDSGDRPVVCCTR